MEKIATDTYSFECLRQGGYVYVDKTDILLSLVDGSFGKQFFIARPRRFGKSLTVSTLQCLFEGRRDLFQGLAIEPKWDWSKTWPVLHLDMGSCQAEDVDTLRGRIHTMLLKEAARNKVALVNDPDVSNQFNLLISELAARSDDGRMVLLVDEYDKPLLGHLGQVDVVEFQRELKAFYSVIKTCEGQQRFAFITGVSKFSKVSIFSDLNNLNEFSMDARVAELFGYTHEEVQANFPESLKALAQAYGWSDEETFATLVTQYDGYRFHQNGRRMFNPVSIGKCLSAHEIRNFWFETGTPTFLLKLLKESPVDLADVVLDADSFSVYEPATPTMMPLLYQTGYLTITDSFREGLTTMYHLGFPNGEVRTAFSKAMANEFSELNPVDSTSLAQIKAKGYHEKYLRAGKRLTLIGAAFDAEMRNLSDRRIERTAQA
ncbi:MAG: AAA family ATPase [bacterium]|nr:AAA family ATPase [bacterium]